MHVRHGRASDIRIAKILNPPWFLAIAVASVIGFAVATRPDSVGTDTANYRTRFFQKVADPEFTSRYEIAFDGMMDAVATVTSSSEVLFGLIYVFLLAVMMSAMWNAITIAQRPRINMFPLAALGLLLISSWFITGSTNGIRQGLSLGVLYLGITLIFFRRKWMKGMLLIGIAPLFHIVATLLWPVAILVPIMPLWSVVSVFFIGAFAYTFGITEHMVKIASQLIGFDAYGHVVNYAPKVEHWVGWQADLFTYTVGWAAIYLIGRAFVPVNRREAIDTCLKIYLLACMPYFILGFGNFSNRYGILGWQFLPIMHAVWIFTARINQAFRTVMALVLFVGGLGRFGIYLNGGF